MPAALIVGAIPYASSSSRAALDYAVVHVCEHTAGKSFVRTSAPEPVHATSRMHERDVHVRAARSKTSAHNLALRIAQPVRAVRLRKAVEEPGASIDEVEDRGQMERR